MTDLILSSICQEDKFIMHEEVAVQAWRPKKPITCSILARPEQKNQVEVCISQVAFTFILDIQY